MELDATIDEVVRRIASSLAPGGDAEDARAFAQAFDDVPAMASHVVAAAHRAALMRRGDMRFSAACYLLSSPLEALAIDEAIGLDSDPEAGPRVRASLRAVCDDGRVAPDKVAVLFNQVGHSGLVPGAELEAAVENRLDHARDRLGRLAPGVQGRRTPAAYVGDLLADVTENVFDIANEFTGNVFAFPPGVRITAARTALDLTQLLGRSAALAWLTDRDPDVRHAVAAAAAATAADGRLDGGSRARVETLMRWMPEADRPALQHVIDGFDRAGVAAVPGRTARIKSTYLSPVAGAGTARVMFESVVGGAWSVSGLATQEKRGLFGGWRQPVTSRGDADRLLADLDPWGDSTGVDDATVRTFLAQRLADARALGHAPSFDVLEAAESAGLMDLEPAGQDTRTRCDSLAAAIPDAAAAATGTESALAASADWPDRIRTIATWRPYGAQLPDVVSIDPDDLPETLVDACLGPRRETLADRLLWLAVTTRAADPDGVWPQFVRVAEALMSHRPMAEIPLARRLVADAVRAIQGADDEGAPAGDPQAEG